MHWIRICTRLRRRRHFAASAPVTPRAAVRHRILLDAAVQAEAFVAVGSAPAFP
jgi:hypothetical protein